jgi:hypothetical protein
MTALTRPKVCLVLVLALAALAVFSSPLSAADIYKARMLTAKAPVEPPVVNIRIEIQSYTTRDDVMRLQEALNQSNDAFLSLFKDMKKGVVRIMDRRGWNLPIHAVQVVPVAKGTKLLCFMLRQNWDPGAQFGRTGADFFMVLELNLNEKGKGDGRLYEDAGINIAPLAGRIEMSRYGSAPKILVSASAEKKAP